MKIWFVVCFVVLLAFVESHKWLQHISVPWPALLLGGAALALLSNGSALFPQTDLALKSISARMFKKNSAEPE